MTDLMTSRTATLIGLTAILLAALTVATGKLPAFQLAALTFAIGALAGSLTLSGRSILSAALQDEDGGIHPFANSNFAKSNPGATVHPTKVQSPVLSAACHACAGTMA
jgi:hypothetical protein